MLKARFAFLLYVSFFQAHTAWTQVLEPIKASIGYQSDVVHLELQGQQQWIYDLDRPEKKQVQIIIGALSKESQQKIENFKSPLVTSVKVIKNHSDGKDLIQFQLARESIETFDYQTENPSRLIVDFFEKTISPAEKIEKITTPKKDKTAALPSKAKRAPALADFLVFAPQGPTTKSSSTTADKSDTTVKAGIFDGADPSFERFQIKDYEYSDEAIIRSRANYFIPYPMLEVETPQWKQVKGTPPIYQIRPQNNDENKQARLLLTLFEKKRYLVFQKTLNWFREKYPESQYNDLLSFMAADVELELWRELNESRRFEVAVQMYREAIQKFPTSPLAEKTSLLLGLMAYDKGDYVTALRLFQEHLINKDIHFQNSLSKDLAQLGQIQVYDKLKRSKEALESAEDLERKSEFPNIKAEAAYRRGDILYRAQKYPEAIQEYQKAISNHKNFLPDYPSAIFNQAEALFQSGKYREALDKHLEFVKLFPMNDHSAFAMTRMAELLEILGADSTRVMGALLETYFRFGENPKATIARIRLTSARMKTMSAKEVEQGTQQILELTKKLDWPQIDTFATIMMADGFTQRGELSKSIELLKSYYQKNPTDPNLGLFQKRLVNNINLLIQKDVQAGQFISALQTHQKYADSWLKSSDRLDTQYFLGRAFEMGGDYQQAEKYYKDTLNRYYSYLGTPQEKELAVMQSLPSAEVMNLRLAQVKFDQSQWTQAWDFLKNIKKPETMSEEEQIERVELISQLLDKKNDWPSAVRFLTELLRTWTGQPAMIAGPYLRLAEIQFKMGQDADAVQSLEKIRSLENDSKQVSADVLAKTLSRLGDFYIEKKKNDEAVSVLEDYLTRFEDKMPIADQRYRLGLIYFEKGQVQKAAEVWSGFKAANFWQSLAQEKLKDSKWSDSYKKYIQRIPAMAEKGVVK